MFEWWWVFVAIGSMVVAFRFLGTQGINGALKEVRKTGEVSAVVAAVEAAPEKKHPNMWDQAIGTLWQEYRREEAMELMMEAAERSDAPVIQFWLKNAMEVEPELAEEVFSEEFLTEKFRPNVAAQCGRVGCCG